MTLLFLLHFLFFFFWFECRFLEKKQHSHQIWDRRKHMSHLYFDGCLRLPIFRSNTYFSNSMYTSNNTRMEEQKDTRARMYMEFCACMSDHFFWWKAFINRKGEKTEKKFIFRPKTKKIIFGSSKLRINNSPSFCILSSVRCWQKKKKKKNKRYLKESRLTFLEEIGCSKKLLFFVHGGHLFLFLPMSLHCHSCISANRLNL